MLEMKELREFIVEEPFAAAFMALGIVIAVICILYDGSF
jgi:hypothetical protein